MFALGALTLLAAILTDTQVPADRTTYGGDNSRCGCGAKKDAYGASTCGCTYGGTMRTGAGHSPMTQSHFGAVGVHSYSTAPTSMPGFGAMSRVDIAQPQSMEPGSWEAAWYGVWYGANADSLTQRIEQINAKVMQIVREILGWAIATKGPRLMSLNSQRDKLVKAGLPLDHPKIVAIENKARGILEAKGITPDQAQRIDRLKAERDELMRKKVGIV